MPVMGLIGGIGSGKSLAAAFFSELGVSVIDTDQIAHALTKPNGQAIPALKAAFGEAVLTKEGSLDRVIMRKRVFSSLEDKKKLEAILHPMIKTEVAAQRKQLPKASYAMLAIPLFSSGGKSDWHLDRVLLIDCQEATQIKRVMARNGLSEAEVRKMMDAQATRAERLLMADEVIENEADIPSFRAAILKQHMNWQSQLRAAP